MKRFGFLAACLLLLLANANIFVRGAYNRSGEPVATVNLTGREVKIGEPYSRERNRAERPVRVRLKWNQQTDSSSWFNVVKLEAIGFDCRVAADAPEAKRHYDKMRPRQSFAVLEYEGPAYEAWRRETELKIRDLEEKARKVELTKSEDGSLKRYKWSLNAQSRLCPVDVGNDPEELLLRHPDRSRFIIAPAVVEIARTSRRDLRSKKTTQIYGEISHLLVESISLSDQQCARLEEMIPRLQVSTNSYGHREWTSPQQLRFTVCYGRSYEPWVGDFRFLEETK
jgi:hypothetical protein